MMKVLMFANTDWYLYNFRLPLALHLAERGAEVVMVAPDGAYSQLIEEAGIRFIPLRMDRRSLNPFSELRVVWDLYRVYRREQPDLVHHFTIKSVAYGSLAAKLAGVGAIINAVAGLGYVFTSDSRKARLLRPLVLLFLRLVFGGKQSRLIVQNPDDRALFLDKQLIAEDRVRLILGSGVNTDRFVPNTQGRGDPQPVVVLATRLLWDKGIGEYVEAARRLKESGVSARFILAGAPDVGNPGSVPQEALERWCDEGVIEPVGHVRDMTLLLQKADIVVLPSAYGEGVPRILIEAAASGLPLVTTDIPGCREIVEHRVNGLLIPPGDVEALAAAMRMLIEAPDRGRIMGYAGREKVLKSFDERAVIGQTEAVYAELVDMGAVKHPDATPGSIAGQ
jgi:glycosyltransferase involved in cell wall biosynthesis